ncbi:MAG: hypothetical protein IPL89_04135 [Acidobacteria bacterium]|nr:hypothetical protein [Acidobacteriota bacterium]
MSTIRNLALAALALSPALHAAEKGPTPPASNQQPASPAALKALQRPDLVVTIDGAGPGFPTTFTVKNIGTADSKLSVLKVSAVFVPPDGSLTGGSSWTPSCSPPMTPEGCAAIAGIFSGLTGGGGASSDPKAACGEPFKEIVEAVPVLKPGESKAFSRDMGPSSILIGGFLKPSGSTQATHVKKCAPTLVCAFDVVAKADASNDNEELNRANNTTTRRAFREVKFQ